MNKIGHKIWRYTSMALMAVFMITSLSCERDLYTVDDDGPSHPRKVKLTLAVETSAHSQEAMTRSLNSADEFTLNNVYVLIFNKQKECVLHQYFAEEDIIDKMDLMGDVDSWVSIEEKYNENYPNRRPDDVNSTCGLVVVEPEIDTSEGCYIFGFGNVEKVNDNVGAMAITSYTDGDYAKPELKTPRAALDEVTTLEQLNAMRIQLSNLVETEVDGEQLADADLVNNEHPNLLYSGAWSTWITKKTTGEDNRIHNIFDDNSLSGWVSPETFQSVATGNNYDLRSIGMIYLRTVVSHVSFNITINDSIFTDFKPESWQIVHAPLRTYFMDDGTNRELHREPAFGKIEPVKRMVHDEGKFKFDFYLLENIKQATTTGNIDYSGTDKTEVGNYYKNNFGESISDTPEDTDGLPSKLKVVYKGNETLFKYAKRDLELKKVSDNQVIWNQKNTTYTYDDKEYTYKYDSKKFVYSEPKATYVVIKGRLLLNPDKIDLKNLAAEGVYDPVTGMLKEINGVTIGHIQHGYADVTYTIHLGYAKKKDADGRYGVNDETDFSIFRNIDYTYNVHINGINSIVTNVLANLEKSKTDPSIGKYRVKMQPGADGNLNLAMNTVFSTDAHYNQFNFMLTKAGLNDFYFEMHTPWSTITSKEVKEDIESFKTKYGGNWMAAYKYDDTYKNKYANNSDFTWLKFTPCYDQNGMFDKSTEFTTDRNEALTKARPTVKYQKEIDGVPNPNLWNLFDFMVSMDALVAASAIERPYNETSEAVRARFNNTLFGQTAKCSGDDIKNSLTVFECQVGSTDYTKANGNPLPFLLDELRYQLVDVGGYTAKQIYEKIKELYNNGNPTAGNEYYKYMIPENDTKYIIKEDYISFLKDEYPSIYGSDDQLASIRRMFYTVYLDEYFYSTPPYGQSWDRPYWTHFVNQPTRYVNFGYRDENGGTVADVDTQYSLDGESSLMTSSLTILQPSIQTFYSTSYAGANYALGVEHTNETHDPRWTDDVNTIGTGNLGHADGREAAIKYVVYKDGSGNDWATDAEGNYDVWDTYVSDKVYDTLGDGVDGTYYNNVTMRKIDSFVALDDGDRRAANGLDNKLVYKAGAIRMCMNRNRDENGNGKIDEDELKWYLPASDQVDLISLCHYSLYDPIFNYNIFYTSGTDVDHQRLPEDYLRGQYLYKYHYVTADYKLYYAEELISTGKYTNATADYGSHPYEMRCVRNLNADENDASTPTDATLTNVFTYDSSTKTFTMDKIDARSIRSTIYHARELPMPHYAFSATNLPYQKFKVAGNNQRLIAILSGINLNGAFKNIVLQYPCHNYYEESDGSDIGSWRTPNYAEMGLMMMQLRVNHPDEKDLDSEFFWANDDHRAFSGTCWNFTGPWGRVLGSSSSTNAWRLYASDIASTSSGWPNKPATEEFSDKTKPDKVFFRCVKDVAQ